MLYLVRSFKLLIRLSEFGEPTLNYPRAIFKLSKILKEFSMNNC
jgi:hypothetical protein